MLHRTIQRLCRRALPLALTLATFTFPLTGCGDDAPPHADEPIVVVGIDSADWTWIDPLMDEGRMPHWKAMVDEGVRADLKSLVPLQKSPTIWASIATGKRPAKHGIADFISHGEKVQTSDIRTAAAYWEIFGGVGHRQAVLGWWVTHPATPVEGVLVSDYLSFFDRGDSSVADAVYPTELWTTIDSLRVRPDDLNLEDLAPFVDVELAREDPERAEPLLEELRNFLAADESMREIARYVYGREPFQCFTVYFRGLDMVSHEYWRYFEPGRSHLDPESWEVRLLGGIIPAYYEYTDRLLGEIRGYVREDSRLLVLSDHGFVGHRRGRQGATTGVQMHREMGALVMAGPGIRSGAVLEKAEVKDFMPTLLVMAGLPVARDVDGHVLGNAFEPDVRRAFDPLLAEAVESYDGFRRRGSTADGADEELNEKVLEQLRSLGYIE